MVVEIGLCRTNNWLHNNGFSLKEEEELYDEQLKDVFMNVRWYLDNLDYLISYRVRWKNYNTKTPTLPKRYVKKRKGL